MIFPKFVSSSENYSFQDYILSLTFLMLAITLGTGYVILCEKITPLLKHRNLFKLQNEFSGLLFLGASAWLVISRRA